MKGRLVGIVLRKGSKRKGLEGMELFCNKKKTQIGTVHFFSNTLDYTLKGNTN